MLNPYHLILNPCFALGPRASTTAFSERGTSSSWLDRAQVFLILSSVILETAAQADGTSTIVWQDDQTGRVWVEEHSRLFCGEPDVPAKSWTPEVFI